MCAKSIISLPYYVTNKSNKTFRKSTYFCFYSTLDKVPKIICSHPWCVVVTHGCTGHEISIREYINWQGIFVIFTHGSYLAYFTILAKKASCCKCKVYDIYILTTSKVLQLVVCPSQNWYIYVLLWGCITIICYNSLSFWHCKVSREEPGWPLSLMISRTLSSLLANSITLLCS